MAELPVCAIHAAVSVANFKTLLPSRSFAIFRSYSLGKILPLISAPFNNESLDKDLIEKMPSWNFPNYIPKRRTNLIKLLRFLFVKLVHNSDNKCICSFIIIQRYKLSIDQGHITSPGRWFGADFPEKKGRISRDKLTVIRCKKARKAGAKNH